MKTYKIYKITFMHELGTGLFTDWALTEEKAMAIMNSNIKKFESNPDNHEIKLVELPTSKGGLVEWLNRNIRFTS